MAVELRPTQSIVLSDIHLSEAGTFDPERPLWKRFKLPEHFVDDEIEEMVQHVTSDDHKTELILNGDIFDFDSVLATPDASVRASWLERLRGLAPEEHKSVLKLRVILRDHPVFVRALSQFVAAGNRLVFVIGNHDVELHWPAVQRELRETLGGGKLLDADQIRFCEWFYVSQGDTLVEHGNQYDDYCVTLDPIHPTIDIRGRARVRLPFGNLCSRFMLNGMGLMNPHVDDSYIKGSMWGYVLFFYRKVARVQPLLVWTWLWGATVTLWHALREGLLPARKDPAGFRARVAAIAERANVTPEVTLALREVHIHPGVFRPWKIAQELWLDRVIIFGVLFYAAMKLISVVEVFVTLHPVWVVLMCMMVLPPFIFYMRSVRSRVGDAIKEAQAAAKLSAEITGVKRVVHGHTHVEMHRWLDDIEYLNTGTWSPAFLDIECTKPYGRRCFAWIRPNDNGQRTAGLYAWSEHAAHLIAPEGAPARPSEAPAPNAAALSLSKHAG